MDFNAVLFTLTIDNLLLNANAVAMSFCETPPAGLRTVPLESNISSVLDRTNEVEPGGTTVTPILARIPPPFLSEMVTDGSYKRAYQRFASAVKSPKLVS